MTYDFLLALALLFLVTLPFVAAYDGEPVPADNRYYPLALIAVVWMFFATFWSVYGRTLGMQSWGLRIETHDGERPGYGRASLRFFCALLSLLPLAAGYWWQLVDRDKLSWHDRLSGTRLVFYGKGS